MRHIMSLAMLFNSRSHLHVTYYPNFYALVSSISHGVRPGMSSSSSVPTKTDAGNEPVDLNKNIRCKGQEKSED